TTVTMTPSRRAALLATAQRMNLVIIEDDYDSEANFAENPQPALRAMVGDTGTHVIYIGSFSKSLAPGLRLGYLVGPADFIKEARALRGMMIRHPPPLI